MYANWYTRVCSVSIFNWCQDCDHDFTLATDLTHVVNIYLLLSTVVVVVTGTDVLTLCAESSNSFCSVLTFDKCNYVRGP